VPIFGLRADFHADGRWKKGPLARHYFREGGHMPFKQSFKGVARNHLALARVCFTEQSFDKYWARQRIFRKKLGKEGIAEVRETFTEQHYQFQPITKTEDEQITEGQAILGAVGGGGDFAENGPVGSGNAPSVYGKGSPTEKLDGASTKPKKSNKEKAGVGGAAAMKSGNAATEKETKRSGSRNYAGRRGSGVASPASIPTPSSKPDFQRFYFQFIYNLYLNYLCEMLNG